MPPAVGAVAAAAVAGFSAFAAGGITILGVTLSAAAWGAVVAAGHCIGPVSFAKDKP
ncbi:MAG: hypothetical protein Kow00114_32910 [Kiloniellaceae bacterium]